MAYRESTSSAGGSLGYTLTAFMGSDSPADSTPRYFGGHYDNGATTTADLNRLYIPKAGTIKVAYIHAHVGGALGTTETSTIAIRLNNTSDTTISSAVTFDAVTAAFSNTALTLAVVQGDYIEIKWTPPAWVTNPTFVRMSVIIYIE